MNDSKFRVTYADIYDPIIDMVKNPSKYGKFILFIAVIHIIIRIFAKYFIRNNV